MDKQKSMDDIAGGDKTGKPLTKEQEAAKRAKDAEEKKKADAANAEATKIKQEQCKIAQTDLSNYSVGGRIANTNEKGEREFLSESDIAKAKEKAKQDVEKYCES